jgi:putative flavoprotein involved in K+ transport
MPSTETVVIGAGHAGLAMSRCLAERGVAYVVLERGRVGERWRTARWDSFRLLTPSWLSRLPGYAYTGSDPDGFMTAGEFVRYLAGYAGSFDAPVRPATPVTRVERAGTSFAVRTDRDVWFARHVVVATGYHSRPRVPALAAGLVGDLTQVTPARYRSPAGLPDGAVLVVGASSSGVQLADELVRAGRPVYLAVGGHTRLPRRYRGRDIMWWLDRIGALDRTVDDVPSIDEPSLQLSGGRRLDLGVLQAAGVQLLGRLRAIDGTVAQFADDLADTVGAAEQRLRRLLGQIDGHAGLPPDPLPPIPVPRTASTVDLRRAGVSTVVWATGYRPGYPWLKVPVLGPDGRIRHRRGVTEVPGLYAIGLRFQYRRNSTFVDGARHDAAYLADHITADDAVRAAA